MRYSRDILFMPLGGGQSVGASCYYLQLGPQKVLLDCGKGWNNGLHFSPNFYALLESSLVQSLGEISDIYISHAHLDHVGAVPEFLAENPQVAVYMTDITKALAEYQFYLTVGKESRQAFAMQNIFCVSYLECIRKKEYTVTFFPAGHISGAMMTLFNFCGKKILYTGDYSLHGTAMTHGCKVPDEPIDIMILCGLHARHPSLCHSDMKLNRIFGKIRNTFCEGSSVYYCVRQLSKGLEFLAMANKAFPNTMVYLDVKFFKLVEQFERLGVKILQPNNYLLNEFKNIPPRSMVIGDLSPMRLKDLSLIRVDEDFSLHDDFRETVEFVKQINPRLCVIVHSPSFPDENLYKTIEQELLFDSECHTQFIFAKDTECYNLNI